MSSRKWLRRIFSRARKSINRRSPLLRLESLEDRVVPNGGTWTPLNQALPSGWGGVMTLLSDGTVMVLSGGSNEAVNTWYRLTPDPTGSYVNGTWSATAPMNVGRLYFGSNVLPDGRLFVVGGEYSDPNTTANWTNTGEIYDPVANTWTSIANFPQSRFGDDPTEVLANGQVLAGYLSGPQTYLYNPATNTWTQAGTKLYNDRSDEETWVHLSDGSILSYDIFSSINSGVPGQAQRYIPSLNQWVDAGSVPVALSSSAVGYELGPALLLPDGRVFQLGANGNTALYNPSTNTWAAGPVIPNGSGADDAAAAILPDGQVIFTADIPKFNAPTQVYDFDPTTNTISTVATPPGSSLSNNLAGNPSFVTRMLMLPNGQLLFSDNSNQLWVYSEAQGPQNAWRPAVAALTHNGATFTLTGTQLTGISEGASYGDDNEMSSNYPVVQLVTSSGTDTFARTNNWTPSVATGSAVQTTNFTEPAGVAPGAYLLSVSAGGITSNDALFVQMGAGANNITLRLDPANPTQIQVLQNGSTLLGEFPVGSFTSILVSGDHADTTTADTLTLDSSNGNPVPAGGLTYDGGGSGNNTLVGPGTANSWQITGHDGGTLNGNVTFTGVQNLTGGSASDYFSFAAGGSIDGNLNGGAAVNTLDDLAWAGAALNVGGFGSSDGYQGNTGGAGSPVGGTFDNVNSFVTTQKFFVQASYLSPYNNTSDVTAQSGSTNYLNSEVEPRIAVDPNNPLHMVGVYQQDRWSDGGSRGNMAAVTFDGGKTWTDVPLPGNTVNNGGFWYRNSDPWVSIGPDGTVYAISIDLQDPNNVYTTGVYVNTSHDGGLTWTAATALILDSGNPFDDKESITADPTVAGYAYAVWDRLNTGGGGPTMFARTTNGGQTWSTPQVVLDPSPGQTISNQVVVLPNGTLVNMCVDINYNTNAEDIVVVRSTDRGQTWSGPILVNHLEAVGVSDPDNGAGVRQGDIIPDLAVDRHNGNVYVVWQDGRFSGFTHDDIALSESTDGGLTWGAPVKVNQTPTNIPAGDQAAFTPTVAVGADGTVAVSYYDFRFNTPDPGLPTDRWIVYARPWSPTSFGNEQRLSVLSFNMEMAPNAYGLFVGDYEGMVACGPDLNSFGTFFAQTVSAQDLSSTFFTVTRPPAAVSPSTVVVSSANPSVIGQSVTFTATVSASTGTPTGIVIFFDGSTVLGTATLDNTGTATFTTSGLAIGSHSVTVSYGGDNTYTPGTSGTLTQVVNQDGTSATLTSTANPSVFGQGVTFTATISAATSGSGTPGGTVLFLDGTTTIGSGTLNGGVATFTTSALAVAGHSITAFYAGDTNHSGSASSVLSQTVNQDGTTTTVASSENPAAPGDNVTFTATVLASGPGSGTPSGTVTFMDGNTPLGTGTLNGGVATFSISTLAAGSHSITAVYGGDTNFSGSTSVVLSQGVNPYATSTALAASANPAVFGQGVTFTATVAGAPGSNGTPSGTVTFLDGSTPLGTGTLSNGVATFTTSGLAPGSHFITAVYGGDFSFASSTSGALSQTVNQDGTGTSLTSSANPSTGGQNVTFTATVSANGPGSGTPSGTVTFLDGSTPLGTGTLSNGTATFTTSGLAPGSHSITAVYGGDTDFTSSASTALSQGVNPYATSTALAASANPAVFGQGVTFTATVTSGPGASGTPSGTVTFLDGATPLGTGTLSNGTATFTTSALAVGGHSITAVYGGDPNFATSSSGNVNEVVNQDGTSTSLTSSANPSVFGQGVTFTATVSAVSPGSGTPSGTVTFMDGAATLGTGTLSGGVATFTTSGLAVGSHSVTAVYGGDTNFAGNTSGALSQTVNQDGTSASLITSANPSVFGQSVTFTSTVSANSPGSGTPSGTVTFKDGSTPLGTGTLNNGTATFTTSGLAVGGHSISVVYGGDANFATSTSGLVSQTVNQGATTTALVSSANPSAFGKSVTFTATVSASSPSSGTPSGTVTFKDGSTTLGTGTLNNGVATFTTTSLAAGSHSVTAVYGGDTNFTGSTSGAVNQSVGPTTTTLTSSLNPSVYGQSVTFTSRVSPVIAGSGTPGGSVTFYDGSTRLGSASLRSGQATFTTAALVAGGHSITAVYGGSTSFATSTSAALAQTVNQDQTTTTLSSSRNPARFGQVVTFTAVVKPVAPGGGTPTGTVIFYDGNTVLGSVTLSSGRATFSTSSLSRGTHQITAKYVGDVDFLASLSSVLNQVIQ